MLASETQAGAPCSLIGTLQIQLNFLACHLGSDDVHTTWMAVWHKIASLQASALRIEVLEQLLVAHVSTRHSTLC